MKRFILVTTFFVITALACFATTVERLSLDDLVKKLKLSFTDACAMRARTGLQTAD